LDTRQTKKQNIVAILESEKTAIIASCIMPELIWLAAGSLNVQVILILLII
jgi:hypothetical protein